MVMAFWKGFSHQRGYPGWNTPALENGHYLAHKGNGIDGHCGLALLSVAAIVRGKDKSERLLRESQCRQEAITLLTASGRQSEMQDSDCLPMIKEVLC